MPGLLRLLSAPLLLSSCLLAACGRPRADPPTRPATTGSHQDHPFTIDLQANPDQQFRIDAFSVPAGSRAEFEATMHQNAALLATLAGFKGHLVFEKAAGPTSFNLITVAVWESPEAMRNAGEKVREHYRSIGFDMPATLARWGVTASLGTYQAPLALQ